MYNNVGRTRVYEFNPRFAFKDQVIGLFKDALARYPKEMQDKLRLVRKRPRRMRQIVPAPPSPSKSVNCPQDAK